MIYKMKDKIKRLKEGKVTSEELDSIVKDIDAMTDSEISECLDRNDSDIDFSSDDLIYGQERINDEIREQDRRRITRRIVNTFAAILIPITVVLIVMLHRYQSENEQYNTLLAKQVTIETGNGESLLAALPDGSTVSMGPKSALTYTIASFCTDTRRIYYKGEGNFSIAKIEDKSFVLNATDFEIKVLGTEFSVISREDKDNAEVYLDKGSIQLISLLSNDRLVMKPGETAILSKKDGDIKVYDAESRIRRSAGQSTMYFTSAAIDDVVNDIELYYGYKVVRTDSLKSAYFTGSLPTDDLSRLKYILEGTLKIKISIDEDKKTLLMK